jgi:hypothetical protein
MRIRSTFTEPPKPTTPGFRYGVLVIYLLLLALHIQLSFSLSAHYFYEDSLVGVVALMLLFNHLAFVFRWSTRVTIALRMLALSWLAFSFVYIFYDLIFL